MKFPGKVDDTMNSAMKKIIPLWLIGLALFGLRFVETRTGFDAVTGLTLPTVARPVLIGGLVLAALYAGRVLLNFTGRPSKGSTPYPFAY